jgi:hypothetical protein
MNVAGLRYESGREMPPRMQELYAVQEVAKMISDGQLTKEEGLERITPQPPMAAAPLQGSQEERIFAEAMPPCNDGEDRRKLRDAWEGFVREKVYRDIRRNMYVMGQFPLAIIVGGEYQYAFLCDTQDIQLTTDGEKLWRGVPIIACGRHNKVSVVWAMDDIDLPKPPEGGFL